MSVFSLLKTKAGAVALVAAACTAALALPQSIPHAEAMPLAGAHRAITTDPNPAVHNIRVIRKPSANKPRKRLTNTSGAKSRGYIIPPSRVQAKGSPTRQVVVVNGKRVVRPVGPVVKDHRAPRPASVRTPTSTYIVNGRRVPTTPSVRTPNVRDHRVRR